MVLSIVLRRTSDVFGGPIQSLLFVSNIKQSTFKFISSVVM